MNEQDIYIEAMDLQDVGQRHRFLEEACGTNRTLRARVEKLIQHVDRVGSFLESPPQGVGLLNDDSHPDGEPPNTQIGPYQLREPLGEGGFGVVYLADQQEPIRRRVALKIIKLGMDTQAVIARFEAERQALAMMDHPHIAKVLDAGATENGRPYFVMELVHGVPITEHCDQHQLTTRERLELFVKVCDAVRHAHERGIIHRDIKPSNVMVTLRDGEAVPKVIDFGIAKATDQRLTERTLATEQGQLIGTPQYMSPEQADFSATDVDTRSDVYSLGVLLYELLVGTTPFEPEQLRDVGYDRLCQIIRETEPPVPSRRLSTLGDATTEVIECRQTRQAELSRQLRGDLDVIVMKALEKDRQDRYATVSDLADDIGRHLRDEPIQARPPTLATRVTKWSHRHRTFVWATAAVLLVAAGLSTIFLWQQSSQARLAAANEAALRRTAESNLYVAQIRLAHEEWKDGNVANALSMLNDFVPNPGEFDLRCWEWHYLKSLCHKDVATLQGHRSSVNWLAWSPDGQRLTTASSDATVRVWDATTRKETATLLGHQNPVVWVAWSPDGRRIYSHSESEAVRIWDSASGESLGSIGADMPALKAAASRDRSRIITTHEGDLVKTWDGSDGSELSSWQAELYSVGPIKLTKKLVVSGDYVQGRIHILDATTGESLHRVATHVHGVSSMAFSPDASRLITGSRAGEIKPWDPSAATELLTVDGHDGQVRQTAWRPDGKQWATVGDDGKIKVWDASTGQEILTLRGHTAQVTRVAWSSDGSLLATGDATGDVKLWNPAQAQESIVLKGRILAAWSPDGTRLVTGGQELGSVDVNSPVKRGKIEIFDTGSWDPVVTIEDEFFGWTRSADWSPDGRRLAMSGRRARVKVWEIPTDGGPRELLSVNTHGGRTHAVAWSPNGRWLAIAGQDRLVNIWDVTSGKQITSLVGHNRPVESVAWSPDGRSIASNSSNDEVKLWDVVTWRELRQLHAGSSDDGVDDNNYSISWSPSGDRLAAGLENGWLIVWDTDSGREVMSVYAHVASINGVCWSPDGRRLATGSDDRSIKIWDSSHGQKLLTLYGHQYRVKCVRWSPSGRQLASASREGIRVWGPANAGVHP